MFSDNIYQDFLPAGFGSIIFASTGSQDSGVDFRHPVITLMELFNCVSILPVCELLSRTGAQYYAVKF
jgi:hypothetical protein